MNFDDFFMRRGSKYSTSTSILSGIGTAVAIDGSGGNAMWQVTGLIQSGGNSNNGYGAVTSTEGSGSGAVYPDNNCSPIVIYLGAVA